MTKQAFMWRCRACGKEFRTEPSPNREVRVKCEKCGSDDVETM